MKGDETRKTKQNNKTTILEKLKGSIMSEKVDSNGVEDVSKNVDNPDDAAELIGRIERIMINKHNQKLIIILENQKIYGGFLEMLIFRVSLSRTQNIVNHFANGFWKVKPEILAFQENLHRSFGFPI